MYLKLNNEIIEKYPYSIGELRRDNPQTSFPATPSNVLLAEWNMSPVKPTPKPEYNYLTQTVIEKQPVNNNGWTQVWEVNNLPQNEAEANVRGYRDELLSESDWTQVADAPVDKAAWAAYRQALRDIPQQAGFPYSVNWPSKPE
jgi:hypothetical protein